MFCKCGKELNNETATLRASFVSIGDGVEAIDVQVECDSCQLIHYSFVETKDLLQTED
jgi:hypothetical protein